MGDVMSATEAGDLLGAMTPGTLEVVEIRDGKLADAGPQEFAVVIHDDARAHQKPDGTWHSVIVCRGMDGPSRGSNAAALSSVKQALASVVALHSDLARLRAPAADVAAIGARAAAYTAAREHVARVLAAPSTPVARLRAAQECDLAAEASAADVLALLALLAAERECHAAEVAAYADAMGRARDAMASMCGEAAAVAALATKGAPDV